MNPLITTHHSLEPYDAKRLAALCGQLNENLHHISKALDLNISNRGNLFQIVGQAQSVRLGRAVLQHLYGLTASKRELCVTQVSSIINECIYVGDRGSSFHSDRNKFGESEATTLTKATNRVIIPARTTNTLEKKCNEVNYINFETLKVQPRGKNQQNYIENISQQDISFGIGPAGTGKTYLAVACAIALLEQGHVSRIILTRPAVEAGEKLGFLPGDIAEKVDPYLKPLYDALHDLMGADQVKRLIAKEIIEIAPLAYMRGRTLNNAFIILDESQNTTAKQMKMFLTRLGVDSKAVITGDPTQIDLPKGVESGITNAIQVLTGVDGVAFNFFDQSDIVRHSLVKKIVAAYDRYEKNTISPQFNAAHLTTKKPQKAGITT